MQTTNETTTTTWTVNKRNLVALCKHASSDAARVSLNCVQFDGPQARAVATDGHRLLKAQPQTSAGGDGGVCVTIPLAQLTEVAKAAKARDEIVLTFGPDGDGAQIGQPGGPTVRMDLKRGDHAFPPVDQVVPTDRPVAESQAAPAYGLDGKYLADVALFSPKPRGAVRMLTPPDPLSPLVVECDDMDDGTAWHLTLMPMRI